MHELIATEVVATVPSAILKVFWSIKTTMVELFNEKYSTVSEAAAAVATTTVAASGDGHSSIETLVTLIP